MQIRDILGRKGTEVATIVALAPVSEAVEALRAHGVGALVVSAGEGVIEGIVSERDVVRALARDGAAALQASVASIMTAEVTTCTADDTVESLMRAMTEQRIRHLPVVDEAHRLCGIVSIGDVVKNRLGELEKETQTLYDYIGAR